MLEESSPLILGSGSPRRAEMLAELGVPLVCLPPDIDESVQRKESPRDYVTRIALEKLNATRRRIEKEGLQCGAVLAADTSVVVDERILGKPSSPDEAALMLEALSGRAHRVVTAYALFSPLAKRTIFRDVWTEVKMRAASADELQRYIETGEGADKAGSYAIQGKGAFLVESISGSYSSVVGLPLCELVLDLQELRLIEMPFSGSSL